MANICRPVRGFFERLLYVLEPLSLLICEIKNRKRKKEIKLEDLKSSKILARLCVGQAFLNNFQGFIELFTIH